MGNSLIAASVLIVRNLYWFSRALKPRQYADLSKIRVAKSLMAGVDHGREPTGHAARLLSGIIGCSSSQMRRRTWVSSFIGHSLTGFGLYLLSRRDESKKLHFSSLWLLWLILVALAPDLDYVVPFLSPRSNAGERITHSLVFSSILPILSVLTLTWSPLSLHEKRQRSIQVIGVGLSHIGMDLLVGVTALPLLWPVSGRLFELPFGILPSAPALRLDNYFLYRNILIEIGILAPLYTGLCLARSTDLVGMKWHAALLGLSACSIGFACWGYTLAR